MSGWSTPPAASRCSNMPRCSPSPFSSCRWASSPACLIGVIIGCATFAVSASRVDAVKFTFDGSEYRSTLDRGPEELAILTAHGHEIQGMSSAELSVLRLGQPALPASQDAVRQATGVPLSGVRLSPGHRASIPRPCTASPRSSRRPKRPASASCWSTRRTELRNAFRARGFITDDVTLVLRPRPRPRDLRGGGHRGAFGRRRRRRHAARLVDPSARQRRVRRGIVRSSASGSKSTRTRLSPAKANPPARCISFSKAGSASSSRWTTGA